MYISNYNDVYFVKILPPEAIVDANDTECQVLKIKFVGNSQFYYVTVEKSVHPGSDCTDVISSSPTTHPTLMPSTQPSTAPTTLNEFEGGDDTCKSSSFDNNLIIEVIIVSIIFCIIG